MAHPLYHNRCFASEKKLRWFGHVDRMDKKTSQQQ